MVETDHTRDGRNGLIDPSEICPQQRGKTHEIVTEYPDYEGVYAVALCDHCRLISGKWTGMEYRESIQEEWESNPTVKDPEATDDR